VFSTYTSHVSSNQLEIGFASLGKDDFLLQQAQKQYRRMRFMSFISYWWSRIHRRSNRLSNLSNLSPQFFGQYYTGLQVVNIAQIRGTQGRADDFDLYFNPLHDRTRVRWLKVALAFARGVEMPPVKLIQVGSSYFVQDGHHRISVARSLGLKTIEAEVIQWQVREIE
jgi:hypothetical protein